MNEPRTKDLKINNVGYQFNLMQKPILNFVVNGPVNFTAKKKRPIVLYVFIGEDLVNNKLI